MSSYAACSLHDWNITCVQTSRVEFFFKLNKVKHDDFVWPVSGCKLRRHFHFQCTAQSSLVESGRGEGSVKNSCSWFVCDLQDESYVKLSRTHFLEGNESWFYVTEFLTRALWSSSGPLRWREESRRIENSHQIDESHVEYNSKGKLLIVTLLDNKFECYILSWLFRLWCNHNALIERKFDGC